MDIVLIVAAAAFWCAGFIFLFHIPLCRNIGGEDVTGYTVSVIVPARNEARNLPQLLASLNAQQVQPYEVIVVDDQSEDETASIAASYGATVLPSTPLPDGWVGKAWACWQGAQSATGALFVFLDADVWLEDDGLQKILQGYARRPGAMSIAPFHETSRPYEQLSAFFNIIMMGSMNAFSMPGTASGPTGLFGPSLIVSRDQYVTAGGHEAVKNRILENFFMARKFLSHGIPLICYGGKDALSFRMYPHGLVELFHGWSKAFATGAGNTARFPFLMIILWLSGMIVACMNASVGYFVFGADFAALGLLLYLAYAAQMHWMLRRIGRFSWYTSVFFPIPLLFFIIVFSRSVILTSRGGVRWKDRTVHT